MRAMRRVEGKWLTETPENLSAWLWANDGGEAVVVDGNVYYCATEGQLALYKGKWESENKPKDTRRAAMFIDLDKKLFQREPSAAHTASAAYCAEVGKLCSERGTCGGVMAGACG